MSSAKLGLIGELQGVSRKKLNDKIVICLEMVCKSRKNADEQLKTILVSEPEPIHYTVLVREKIYNKLIKNLDDPEEIIGKELYIIGIPVLDLPMSIVEGEIGVYAYHAENASEKRIELRSSSVLKKNALSELQTIKPRLEKKINQLEYKIDQLESQKGQSVAFWIDVDEIECPKRNAYEPNVIEATDYYRVNGCFPGEIQVKVRDSKWFVADGYSKLVAAKRLNLKRVQVIYKI